jgi:pyruvate dehydrogenase E2 component (dihydrolipoamide acetyltransferase)
MPSLGADMEAGTLVEWLVRPGQSVKRGDVVAVVETDKGAIDVEIWENGAIESLLVPAGAKVPVGTTLATVRAAADGVPAAAAAAPAIAAQAMPAPAATAPAIAAQAMPAPAAALPIPATPRASPAARKRAFELNVELAHVTGTGPHGAVTLADVEAAAERPLAPAPAPAPSPPVAAEHVAPAPSGDIRRAIGAAMARSKREIPHYYLATEVDVSAALRWLEERNRGRPVSDRLLPVALFLKATALAAKEIPGMNGFWTDDVFHPSDAVHVGVGISLRANAGLVAPALHDVDRKPLDAVMHELGDLIARTRKGHLRSSELADATITVTSLGDQGAETVFGIIYPPQVALVGFGSVLERPRAVGGLLGVRPTVNVTLAGDHRASDGHTGALFLAAIARRLAEPEGLA